MIAMYEAGTSPARPNAFVHTAVINACAYADGDKAEKANALRIATATFNELSNSEYGEPNDVTYATYLMAIRNLMPNDDEAKAKTIANVFQKCCKEGKVSKSVLWQLKRALTEQERSELYRSLGFHGVSKSVSFSQVPAEWKRNVVEAKGRQTWPRR